MSKNVGVTNESRRCQTGFTLLEVMIALSLLVVALVFLVGSTSANVAASNRAKYLTVATQLARAKMLDLEEELLHNGFQDTPESMEGDFAEEGYARMRWQALIEKVELFGSQNINQLLSRLTGADANAASKANDKPQGSSLLGMLNPSGTGPANLGLVAQQFEMVKGVLENGIRKVTLTIFWNIGKTEEKLDVVCYFTDPKAVDRATMGVVPTGLPSNFGGGMER